CLFGRRIEGASPRLGARVLDQRHRTHRPMTAAAEPRPIGRLTTKATRQVALSVGGIVAMLVLWQVSVPLVHLSSYFYPAPSDVLFAFYDVLRKGILTAYLVDSISRYAIGVLLGTAIGVGLGLAIGRSRFLARLLGP